MEMSYRKQLNDNRPYWKVLVSLVFSLIFTGLFLWVGMKLIIYFMPFVIGWFIAFIVSPVVNWLEEHLKLVKKFGSAITIILVLAVLIGLIYLAGKKLFDELQILMMNLPQMYGDFEKGLDNITDAFSGIISMLPSGVREGGSALASDMDQSVSSLIDRISVPTVNAAERVIRAIPSILIGTIVTILSAYFIVADRENLIERSKKIAPDPIVKRVSLAIYNLKYSVGGYFKAQFQIMLIIWAILIIGFMLLGIDFNFILSLFIAFLDFLPFFGTGTAFVPWIIYEILTADYKMAIGLLVLYPITQIVHRTIEPKLLGDSVGLNPLLTLVLIYIGYKVGSVLGMIFAVPIGIIIINMFKAGSFDYILDDAKTLIEGILSLREKG